MSAPPPAPRRVALAALAHPDDAELLCAGTLIRLREEHGYDLHIATATAGDCGSIGRGPAEIAAVRREEGAAAAAAIGATYHCLGLMDLRVTYGDDGIRGFVDVMRAVNPTLVFTHPRQDYMIDHEQVHLLVRDACFGFPMPNLFPATRPPAGAAIPHLYYVDPLNGHDPYTGAPAPATTLIDIAGAVDRKAEMLACHASQREWLREHHGMDEYLLAMRAHAAWRGEPLHTPAAEAFVQHRGHPFPADDLLTDLLAPKA